MSCPCDQKKERRHFQSTKSTYRLKRVVRTCAPPWYRNLLAARSSLERQNNSHLLEKFLTSHLSAG
jgi:hypothetical protein